MTDKLTPGQLRDLADMTRSCGIELLSVVLREEAARREAEARPQTVPNPRYVGPDKAFAEWHAPMGEREGPLTGIEAGPDAVHPKPPADDMERAADAVINCLREDKPAPAADDLVGRLRGRACDSWEICEQAADRIEAQAREIAEWRRAANDATALATKGREAAERLEAANARLREELAWYGEQARLARLIHSEGDAGRHALAADGGKRAKAALAVALPIIREHYAKLVDDAYYGGTMPYALVSLAIRADEGPK